MGRIMKPICDACCEELEPGDEVVTVVHGVMEVPDLSPADSINDMSGEEMLIHKACYLNHLSKGD